MTLSHAFMTDDPPAALERDGRYLEQQAVISELVSQVRAVVAYHTILFCGEQCLCDWCKASRDLIEKAEALDG